MNPTRQIQERWIITGKLELLTPAHLSNGDDDPTVDLPILTDPVEGRVLLTGASLTGALRSYLQDFAFADDNAKPAVVLFGGERGEDTGGQSPLIVENALGSQPIIELRDGVAIDPKTRTTKETDKGGEKYDQQLLAAGTSFDIGFELLLTESTDRSQLKESLKTALLGLQAGEIRLGGRKRRGLGECKATNWRAQQFNLSDKKDLIAWLVNGRSGESWAERQKTAWTGTDIGQWLPLQDAALLADRRDSFHMTTDFVIDGSVLIRSGFETEKGPDMAHLESRRGSKNVPVLSGTSLGGVIRAQAARIARTMNPDPGTAERFIKNMFGISEKDKDGQKFNRASRVLVSESTIEGGAKLVQSRVKIDRFTGGAFESALFAQQPVFGGETQLRLELTQPKAAEIGLLLLVLKDLWTGYTPIGGEASVGRGRLRGIKAILEHKKAGEPQPAIWEIQAQENGGLVLDDKAAELETYVAEFVKEMGG